MTAVETPNQLSRFLSYQVDSILDDSRLVLYEKSIRIGITYAMAFKAVRNRLRGQGNYLHTSVNERIGKSFALDCRTFCEIFDLVERYQVKDVHEWSVYNPVTDRNESAFEVYFEGTKCAIKIFSSNPDSLRGEGGDVGIDELTSHREPEELLKAAGGRAMWGHRVWIWSSHRGEASCFNRLIQEERAKGKNSRWKILSTDLYHAIDAGLIEKINETRGTTITREQFIADTIAMVGGQEAFEEECLLKARRGGTAAIRWDYINHARQPYDVLRFDLTGPDEAEIEGIALKIVETIRGSAARLGYDVARTGHLSAVWVNRKEGRLSRLAALVKLQNTKFGTQRLLIERIMRQADGCLGGGDKTGLGMQVCEELAEKFGEARFVGVNFGQLKAEMGTNFVRVFEDGRQILPEGAEHDDIAFDVAAIQQDKLPSGRVSFTETANPIEKRSHCDLAWAGAIANYVDKEDATPGIY